MMETFFPVSAIPYTFMLPSAIVVWPGYSGAHSADTEGLTETSRPIYSVLLVSTFWITTGTGESGSPETRRVPAGPGPMLSCCAFVSLVRDSLPHTAPVFALRLVLYFAVRLNRICR